MVDQPGAIAMYVPDAITFDSTDATWIVLHKTAGFSTAQQVAEYFQAGSDGRNVSAHYVVGLDGTIVQCVAESRGAGANCCTEAGYASFLPAGVNLNVKTISIEHVDPSTDNSMAMPPAQIAASFRLIHDICVRHNIPMRAGDGAGGVIGHDEIAPQSRGRCPGPTYPWSQLWQFLGGEHVGIPQGWKDDGTTLTAPNGIAVVKGFRDFVLKNPWDPANIPLEAEHGADPLEISNPSLGGGTKQTFRWTCLEWSSSRGVFMAWMGQELIALEKKIQQLQAEPAPAPVPVDIKSIAEKAIADLQPLLK